MADAFLDWLAALPMLPKYAVLMALSALENVFPPVPADVAIVLGAFLAQRGGISAPVLGFACWLSNTASAAAMYLVGRRYGAAFFGSGWPSKLLPPEAMAALRDAFDRHGMAGVFVSRFLPGLRAAVTPFAGVMGMPPARALVPAAAASALWYAFLVALGSAAGLSWDAAKALLERTNTTLGVVALVAVGTLALWLRRRSRPPCAS